MTVARRFVLMVLLSGSAASAAEVARPTLAVFDLEARGADPLKAQAVTVGVVRGVRQLDVFQVLSADDVRQLLAIERSRQLMGSGGNDLSPVNEALGARHAITGSLTSVGEKLQVELRLLDTSNGKVLSQKTLGPVVLADLVRDVPNLSQELVSPLLMEQQGTLLVRSSEEASEVVVDEVLRGSTPMKEPLPLPRGAHRLEVRKDGFISQTVPVRVEPGEVTTQDVSLVPSPDYAEAYKQRHGRLRIGAYITTVVAVGAFGGALLLDRNTDESYRNEFLPRRAALDESAVNPTFASAQQEATYAGCLGAGRVTCSTQMEDLVGRLRTQQFATAGLVGVGVISTGVATYLWLTGEDPNRYSRLVASVRFGDSPGLALGGTF